MTSIPLITAFNDSNLTEGQYKAAFATLHDYLTGLLGSDGTARTALKTIKSLSNDTILFTGASTIDESHRGFLVTSSGIGGWTLNLPASATVGSGFSFIFKNGTTGNITVDPNLSELIDGLSTLSIAPSRGIILVCNGSQWQSVGINGFDKLSIASGVPASPGLFFIDDIDTGFTNPASGRIGFASNGVIAAILEPVGTSSPNTTSIMTREKADNRYPQLSAANTLTNKLTISNTTPLININDTDGVVGGSNYGRVNFQSSGVNSGDVGHGGTTSGQMYLRALNGDVRVEADVLNTAASSRVMFTVDGVSAGTLDPAGTSTVSGLTIMTREKGDTRYAQLGAANTFTSNQTINASILGTAVTQTSTDTTAGRLLKVGDFGLGSNAGIVVTDYNALTVSGLYRNSAIATGSPTASSLYWSVLHFAHAADGTASQFAMRSAGVVDNEMYFRRKAGGTWSVWDKVFHSSNLLGTVSQTLGVPTGAVIERGSNANGEYVKFADGTMTCTKLLTGLGPINVARGSGFITATITIGTLPATFIAAPARSLGSYSPTSIPSMVMSVTGPTTTTGGFVLLADFISTAAVDHCIMATFTGRWF